MKYLHSYASLDAFKAEAGSLPVPQVVVTTDGTTKYVSYKSASASSFHSHKMGEAAIVDILSDSSHGGIVVKFNLTGGDGNTIGGSALYDALQTLYVDGSVFDIDDLVVTAGSGSGSASGSGSGANVGGIALPDTLSGEHTVEFVLSDGLYILPNGEFRTGMLTGNENIVGSIVAETKYCMTQNTNGYEYVDLGLPSGTLWATCNVGATSAEGYGKFFQWGATEGYEEGTSAITSGHAYDWANTPYSVNAPSSTSWSAASQASSWSKYNVVSAQLDSSDDAASVNMGGDWLMPTKAQLAELIDGSNTKREYNVEVNGVKGYRFISKKDATKSIFIPFAGFCYGSYRDNAGNFAYLWSRVLDSDYIDDAWYLDLYSDGYRNVYIDTRYSGYSVRGVL